MAHEAGSPAPRWYCSRRHSVPPATVDLGVVLGRSRSSLQNRPGHYKPGRNLRPAGLDGPDLHAASSKSGTKATIQVTRSLMAKQGLQVLDSVETGDPSGRAWAEAGEIDHRGHDVGIRIVEYLDEEVERIARRTRELLAAGWQRVEIITDHGWLLMPGAMPKVDLPVATTEKKKGRCARLKDGDGDEREQKSWDAGLSGTKRDGCGTDPVFAGVFYGAAGRRGIKTFGWRFPPIRRFSRGV